MDGKFEKGHTPHNKGRERSEITKLKIKATKLEQENKKLRQLLERKEKIEYELYAIIKEIEELNAKND